MDKLKRYWNPILQVLAVRKKTAAHDFESNASGVMGRLFIAFLLALAALSLGYKLSRGWSGFTAQEATTQAMQFWIKVQFFWFIALLLPGVLSLFGRAVGAPVLRSFSLRPSQMFFAETLCLLCDTPTLMVACASLPLFISLAARASFFELTALFSGMVLLALQTAGLATLCLHFNSLFGNQVRKLAEIPAFTAILLFFLCVAMPPAFASLTTYKHGKPYPPAMSKSYIGGLHLQTLIPAAQFAEMTVSARTNELAGLLRNGSALLLSTFLSLSAGYFAVSQSGRIERSNGEKTRLKRVANPADSTISTLQSPFQQTFAVVQTELTLLLRQPQTYLKLSEPAGLILLCFMALLAPDMGKDPVYNVKELLGIGGICFNLIWQLQLFCNRFGSESGTATFLFSSSVPRLRLLLGKNIALFILLILIDSAAIPGLMIVAEAPQNTLAFLLWLPVVLIILTSFGNLLSIEQPYSISRRIGTPKRPLPDVLGYSYVLVAVATGTLIWGLQALIAKFGVVGWTGSIAIVISLYLGTLQFSAKRLQRIEGAFIGQLDRGERG